MGLGTGIPVESGFDIYANSPADKRFGPYADVATANSSIDINNRYQGLTIGITVSGKVIEYWYSGGVDDINLIIKDAAAAAVVSDPSAYLVSPAMDEDTTIDISGVDGSIVDVYFNGSLLTPATDYVINGGALEWQDVDVTLKTWHVFLIKYRPAAS